MAVCSLWACFDNKIIQRLGAILGFCVLALRGEILWRNEGFLLILLIKPKMYPKKPLAQNVLFCPWTTLCWPISHHLLWLTPFWRSSTMTLLPRHRQTGTHKADGCDNSFPTLSWLEKRIEQRCDGEGHQAIVPQCAEWVFLVTPCRSRFKDWGEGPDSDGWWSG